ncbi:MAG: hypothetical protein WCB27_25230 [Thermoguttaceae bacterium]
MKSMLPFVLIALTVSAGSAGASETEKSNANTKAGPDTWVRFATSDAKLQALYDLAEKKEAENVRVGKDGRKVLVEGDEWSYGLWLETQPMGGVMYAPRDLSIARNNIEFFIEFQKENGLLPCTCIREPNGEVSGWHGSLGMLSLAQASLDFYYLSGKNRAFLDRAYRALEAYDGFLWKYRDSDGDGCLELWGIGDTGEDQTTRFNRAPHVVQDPMTAPHNPEWDVPVQSMDIMSDSYVARATLAEMARLLGNGQESKWQKKAQDVRDKVKAYLWRPELHACYDRDKTSKFIECLCHNNLRCMYRGTFTQEMADEFVKYHLMNPREFWTYMPLPSIAISDPYYTNDEVRGYCHWAGPSQGLTYQRAIRALENYGHFAELTLIGRKLLAGLSGLKAFPVCFVPTTGKPRGEHGNYGPMVLSALEYISRLYGVHVFHDQVYWSGLADGNHDTTYTQYWLGREFKLNNSHGTFSGYLNGRKVFSCTAGVRVLTDLNGTVREVVGIDPSRRKIILEAPETTYRPAQIGPNQVLTPAGKDLVLRKSVPFVEPSGMYEVDAKTQQGLVTFTGAWQTVPAADAYCKTMALSRRRGDAAQFEFVGTEIRWIGKRGANCGRADVSIDGRLQARNVDLYGPDPQQPQQILFQRKGLGNGTHTIKIVIDGGENAHSSDTFVGIDAFQYGE